MFLFTQTALKKSSISAINERVDCMEHDKKEKKEKKTFTEQLAEEMAKVPDDKKEVVAALLLGTCQGVQIAAQMQHRATA